jgi:triacylglycerol lipase
MHTPVLLVPGWSDRPRVMRRLRQRFVAAGWPDAAVEIVSFEDRFGSNVAHAEEVDAAAHALLSRRGAPYLDVVAHSMGGLAVRRFIVNGECRVRRAIFLGTPHAGTWAALAAWGGGRREMMPGSEFLRSLPPLPEHIRCTTIRTPLDLRIFPGSSARIHGAQDIVIRLATHQGLLRSRAVFESILSLLQAPEQ